MKMMTELALANDRKNRTRSILIMISIWLTVVLLCVVASFGCGMVRSQHANAGLQYGTYYGTFRKVSWEKTKELELRSEFREIGRMAQAGTLQDGAQILYADTEALEMNNLIDRIAEGTFPKEEREILAGAVFFEKNGLKEPKPGDTVTLECRRDLASRYQKEEFVVCGILKEPQENPGAGRTAYVSEAYYDAEVPKEEQLFTVYFCLDESIPIHADTGEEVIKELAAACGIAPSSASDNYAYLMWALDPGIETLVVCGCIIAIIVLFSTLVVYNIFQVGVVQKIQEYGKVRAIGATKRQMRELIWREGMLLAAVSVPAGMLAGILMSLLSFEWLTGEGRGMNPEGWVEVSPLSAPLLAAVAAIGFLTVHFALRRPMRIVASVSPVEAIRYQEQTAGRKSGIRRGRKTMSAAGLTFASLSGQKKRNVMTVFTMGLSCVLFLTMANFAGNMDEAYEARKSVEYGDFELELDYSMNDTAYPENNLDAILKEPPLDDAFLDQLRSIEGVTEVRARRVLLAKMTDEKGEETGAYETVGVLDREAFDREADEGNVIGEFSYDSVSASDGIIFGRAYFMEEYGAAVGDRAVRLLSDGTERQKLETVTCGAFGAIHTRWAITEDTWKKLGLSAPSYHTVWVACQKGEEAAVHAELVRLLSEKSSVRLTTYADALKISGKSIRMMKEMCYSLAVMIAVISFLNMANTLVTSVITRRQEFGMLQAIGMTNRQLAASLIGEGGVLTLGTILVAMAVGTPCGYALFEYGKTHGWIGLNIWHFPVMELGMLIAFLGVFQMVLSFVLTRNVKRETIIERIRYQG